MKNNLIVGNGLIIQFGGAEYLNSNIIKRAFEFLEEPIFPIFAIPYEIGKWIKTLHVIVPDILKGSYDQYAVLSEEPEEMREFKTRYKADSKYYDIGFEDYFFLHHMFSRKMKITNSTRYNFQEWIKRFFLHSIYNKSKINEIWTLFPRELISFLNSFDEIFTTNYDSNLESVFNSDVRYLHGSFEILDDPYNPESMRNQLSDRPIDEQPNIEGFEYLFSNAISNNSGRFKESITKGQELSNSALQKLLMGYNEKPELRNQIDKWKDDKNSLVKKMYESIMLLTGNPDLKYIEGFDLSKLSNISGSISIIGLSPYNDSHLFKTINANDNIDKIEFYYFEESEIEIIKQKIESKEIQIKSIREFWKRMKSST